MKQQSNAGNPRNIVKGGDVENMLPKQSSEVSIEGKKKKRRPGVSLGEELAGDSLCMRNYRPIGIEVDFPFEPDMRTVSRLYPHAKDRPLCVDEVSTEAEAERMERKRAVLRKHGFDFVILTPKTELQAAYLQMKGNRRVSEKKKEVEKQ